LTNSDCGAARLDGHCHNKAAVTTRLLETSLPFLNNLKRSNPGAYTKHSKQISTKQFASGNDPLAQKVIGYNSFRLFAATTISLGENC